jgi:hypothetical protein
MFRTSKTCNYCQLLDFVSLWYVNDIQLMPSTCIFDSVNNRTSSFWKMIPYICYLEIPSQKSLAKNGFALLVHSCFYYSCNIGSSVHRCDFLTRIFSACEALWLAFVCVKLPSLCNFSSYFYIEECLNPLLHLILFELTLLFHYYGFSISPCMDLLLVIHCVLRELLGIRISSILMIGRLTSKR